MADIGGIDSDSSDDSEDSDDSDDSIADSRFAGSLAFD